MDVWLKLQFALRSIILSTKSDFRELLRFPKVL